MKKKAPREIELPARAESFSRASSFIRRRLDEENISKEIVSETMLVFEALFHNLLAQENGTDTTFLLSCRNRFGNIVIRLDYEGEMVYLFTEDAEAASPEDRILKAYQDKVDCSYHSGFNSFRISVRRKHLDMVIYCLLGILLAGLLYLPIHFLMPPLEQMRFAVYFLQPLEHIYGNAALMIGAPVTFFSLLTNLTDTYILSERYSDIRRLQTKSIITSVTATLIAMFAGFFIFRIYHAQAFGSAAAPDSLGQAFSSMISEAVPSSIFGPFESLSPLPLIVVALIMTYAFCNSGRYLVKLKKVVDVCSSVFSSMLSLVLFALPFFFFVVFLEMLLLGNFNDILVLLQVIVLILLSSLLLLVYYLIRLLIGGVKPGPFLKKLAPLLMENSRINSAIDAAPYNIRYCAQEYGMDRASLQRSIPVLAQINRDGNCFLLMMIAMFCMLASGDPFSLLQTITFAILIVFLSFGAPNQPGTFLIGTLILFTYMGYEGLTYLAIIMEVAFGTVQNIINVAGDIVTVAIDEKKHLQTQSAENGG